MTHTSNRFFCLQAKLIIDKYKFILKGVLPKYISVCKTIFISADYLNRWAGWSLAILRLSRSSVYKDIRKCLKFKAKRF